MPCVWIQYLVLVIGEQVVDEGLCPLCRQQCGNLVASPINTITKKKKKERIYVISRFQNFCRSR
jgi:hypothetical protein